MSEFASPAHASPADRAACAAAIRQGSKSFHMASRLLPDRVRQPAFALYAFCRLADDAVDTAREREAPERLMARLDRLCAGRPGNHAADRALADAVRAHGVPFAVPAALIEGLAWDLDGRRYATMEDLEDYAARVAGTVGVMMTLIMGVRRPEVVARACDLGVAMQLSNICRDVGEDAHAGRLYLPLGWMREEGIDPDAFVAAPRHSPALARVVARVLARAEALYARSLPGIAALPSDCRPAIRAARLLYREIGRRVAACGHDAVATRAVVPTPRKLALLADAAARAPAGDPAALAAPPLGAVRFLVDAVAAEALLPAAPVPVADRVSRALDIFVTASVNVSASRVGRVRAMA